MKTILYATLLAIGFYFAAGGHFTRPAPLVAQDTEPTPRPATADLQKAIDEQQRTLANVVAALERIDAARPASPATRTATEVGCVPGDGRDDHPALQAALDDGYNLALDGSGLYELSAPLRIAPGTSNVIRGQSAGYRHRARAVTGLRPLSESVSHLIEVPGVAEKSTGQVQVIRDLYLEGTAKTDGIRVHGCDALRIESVCVRKCKTGIAIDPKIRCYAPALDGCAILGCDVGLSIKNGTSVCSFSATGCEILTGRVGVAIDGWKRGAVFTGCVIEGQSELCLAMQDARCTLIGTYLENSGLRARMKNSHVVGIDATVGNASHNATSRIDWLGENNRPYTVAYPPP